MSEMTLEEARERVWQFAVELSTEQGDALQNADLDLLFEAIQTVLIGHSRPKAMSEMTLEEAWEQFDWAGRAQYGDEHKRCMCDSCVALRRILQDCPRSTTVAAGVRILNESGEPETLVALLLSANPNLPAQEREGSP